MKILVTGSTGFIGSHLCRELILSGHHVRAFHRTESPLLALSDLPVEHVFGDITRPETLLPALANIEVVFHAAAHVGRRDPRQIYQTTVIGTRNILSAAQQAGVSRVIHTSSVAALGVPLEQDHQKGTIPVPINENHSWNYPPTWWPYGYTKYLAELEVQKAVAAGMDAVIVNPALVIGPGDLNRIAGDILLKVAHRQVPVAIEGGLNIIHITDVIRGHISALETGKTGQRYILGNKNLTHANFLSLIANVASVPQPRWILPAWLLRNLRQPISALSLIFPLPIRGEALHRVGYYFYYDCTKAENELGMLNRRSTLQAIKESLNWYQKQGNL